MTARTPGPCWLCGGDRWLTQDGYGGYMGCPVPHCTGREGYPCRPCPACVPAPVSGDLRTTYERFRHLDRLLSDPAWVSGSPVAATLRDLWMTVKAEVESRRGAQAPVPPGERGGEKED